MNELKRIINLLKIENPNQKIIEVPDFGRLDLAALFKVLDYKVGAEIGTLRGEYAESICQLNPGVKLYCVDPYIPYKGYREHRTEGELPGFFEEAQERLKNYNVEFVKKFSVDAAQDFKPNSLDFVYIDANHALKHVIDDIAEWYVRVRPGGIIAGHDYIKHKRSHGLHVVHAVQAYTTAYDIAPYFVLGRKKAEPGEIRDKFRSWFWVKP